MKSTEARGNFIRQSHRDPDQPVSLSVGGASMLVLACRRAPYPHGVVTRAAVVCSASSPGQLTADPSRH